MYDMYEKLIEINLNKMNIIIWKFNIYLKKEKKHPIKLVDTFNMILIN
jgi:hypothetical protein